MRSTPVPPIPTKGNDVVRDSGKGSVSALPGWVGKTGKGSVPACAGWAGEMAGSKREERAHRLRKTNHEVRDAKNNERHACGRARDGERPVS
jgi:hypothetical protein